MNHVHRSHRWATPLRCFGTLLSTLFAATLSLAQAPAPMQPVQRAGFRPEQPPTQTYAPPATPRPAAPAADPVDYPLSLVAEASKAFQTVRDYSCTFVKREQVGGRMQAENVMTMKVRQQPFSVSLRWLAPNDLAGQEAVYVAGRNNGALRVHATGIRGVAGFVSIAPNDPRVTSQSRHSITEAGLGNLIETLHQNWTAERGLGRSQIRAAEYVYNKRPCIRVETTHQADPSGRQLYGYRTVVYFDKEFKVPVRMEAYDWPRRGGDPNGDPLEVYSYLDLKFNVGLNDEVFRR